MRAKEITALLKDLTDTREANAGLVHQQDIMRADRKTLLDKVETLTRELNESRYQNRRLLAKKESLEFALVLAHQFSRRCQDAALKVNPATFGEEDSLALAVTDK